MSNPSHPAAPTAPTSSGHGGGTGRWLVLTAALLGWMFDGLEMGLFPLVAKPAMRELLTPQSLAGAVMSAADAAALDKEVTRWITVIYASFLVGAATGGVLFGWLGDRVGRVKAMTLSVLVYAVFTGLCGLANSPWEIAFFRFLASLGMGGEWALGVALVMEVWQLKSRGVLAGLIGSAANVGYLIVGFIGLGLSHFSESLGRGLVSLGAPAATVDTLIANDGWRLLMIMGSAPALLTLLIRFFVPESESWEKEKAQGRTSQWATRDLLGVLVGAAGPLGIIYLWATDSTSLAAVGGPVVPHTPVLLVVGSLLGFALALGGYLFPVVRYMGRSMRGDAAGRALYSQTIRRMLLGAGLAGVALLTTWGTTQMLPTFADNLFGKDASGNKVVGVTSYVQIASSVGAIFGTIAGAMLGDALGRRLTYSLLCASGFVSVLLVFNLAKTVGYGPGFLGLVFLAGFCSASFYGWLPLYLPELFATRVRATGQGFSFNFGRIFAAVGVLQLANLKAFFNGDMALACSALACIYILGIPLIFMAPETHGQPLPD